MWYESFFWLALLSGDQHRVLFARRVVHRKIYKLHIPASGRGSNVFAVDIVAVLSSCLHYEGDGLKQHTPNIDLSVEVDTSPLRRYQREQQAGPYFYTVTLWSTSRHTTL